MHFIEAKSILSSNNGLNIYRGCTHGCIYCDSRSKCYNMDHDFTDVAVKENALKLLEIELKKKRNRIMIGTGSMSDPYQPIERELELTRGMLKLINRFNCGVHIITKSDLILRDLDILKEINKHSKVVVAITITTFDDKITSIIEPNVCNSKRRFEVLKILRDNNIETGIWFTPLLPFINDTKENINGILNYAIEAKVKYLLAFDIGLTLREGNREYFYEALSKNFFGLKGKYISQYGNNYFVRSKTADSLMKLINDTCVKNNIMCEQNEIFEYISTYESKYIQLSLF